MKNLLYLLLAIALFSCKAPEKKTESKYAIQKFGEVPSARRLVDPSTLDTVLQTTYHLTGSYSYDSIGEVRLSYKKPEVPPVVVIPDQPAPTTGVPATAKQVFYADFNTFSIFENENGKFYQLGRGVIAKDGTNSVFHSEVKAGDAAISSGFRSEHTIANMPVTGEMYFTFKARMLKYPGSDLGHFFQVHPSNSTGSAAFAIYFSNKQFSVIRSLKKGENIYESARKSYNLNQWYNFRVHAKWSSGSDGLVEVFIDDVPFQTSKGPNLPGEGGYLKFGINMWSSITGLSPNTGMAIDYDELRIYRN